MPKLEEYKAKDIFRREGIAVPDGCAASSASEIDDFFLNGSNQVVLKSQVTVGARGKKGGIVFAPAETVVEAFEALINREIDGILPDKLLLERKIEYSLEYYMSVYSCSAHRCPVLMFSTQGGGDVEETGKAIVFPIEINLENMPENFFRNHLSKEKSISAADLDSLASIAEALYVIYRRYDCKLVEINPLVKAAEGFVALDAKMVIDEDALFRQDSGLDLDFVGEIEGRRPTKLEIIAGKIDEKDHRGTAHFVQLPAESIREQYRDNFKAFIGFNCVGTGASLTVMDEVSRLGYFPRNFADTSGNPTASKVYRMTKIVLSQKDIKGYIFATCVSSQQLDNTARGIIKAFKEIYSETGGVPDIPSVLLFRGAWEDEALELFKEHGLFGKKSICILDPDSTERDIASTFDMLYREWADG